MKPLRRTGSSKPGHKCSLASRHSRHYGPIEGENTTHNTPEYNGVSKRLNRTLLERTRAHAVWLKNGTSTRALPDGRTPYEMLYNKRPDLGHLREWGSRVMVHAPEGSKRVYWPEKRSVTVERSVKFGNNDVVVLEPEFSVVLPIQGETEKQNPQHDESNETKNTNNSPNSEPKTEILPQLSPPLEDTIGRSR